MNEKIIHKDESYQIIGCCLEVHKILGGGLLEVVYKDALEHEFNLRGIPFQREKAYPVVYKDVLLPHRFFADFVVFENIILEVKALKSIEDLHLAQTLNYLRLAKSRLGLIVNFHELSLRHKRVLL